MICIYSSTTVLFWLKSASGKPLIPRRGRGGVPIVIDWRAVVIFSDVGREDADDMGLKYIRMQVINVLQSSKIGIGRENVEVLSFFQIWSFWINFPVVSCLYKKFLEQFLFSCLLFPLLSEHWSVGFASVSITWARPSKREIWRLRLRYPWSSV